MKLIPLTQGCNAIVDDADYEWLQQWKWTFTPVPTGALGTPTGACGNASSAQTDTGGGRWK